MTNVAQNAPDRVVSHYRVLRKLGAGGMGEVYLAEDTDLGRQVAIKFLSESGGDSEVHSRLLREARAVAALDHPNICDVYEVNAQADPPFIVMQYVEGETLAARLRRGPLPPDQALKLAMEMADALSAAHRQGIVHRDVKPQNIMLTPGGHAKLLDFGIARHRAPDATIGSESTQTVTLVGIIGTPAYMAPEQIQCRPIDGRTDLFALGAVIYECLTGLPPFSGKSQLDVFAAILHVEPPPPSRLVPTLTPAHDDVCARLLKKSPDDRFQTATEALTAVRELVARIGKVSDDRPKSLSRQVWIGLAGATLLFGATSVWLLRGTTLSLKPSPEAARYYQAGMDALQEGAYAQASVSLKKATEVDSGYPMAWARLAEAQLELDEEERAKESLITAVGLVDDRSRLPTDVRLALEGTMGMVNRDYRDAQTSYEALVGRQPASAPVRLDLGRAYEAGEATDKAIEQYVRASELNPENPASFLRLGILYGRDDDLEAAMKALARAETLYEATGRLEGVAWVSFHRGIVLSRRGDRAKDARAALERAQQLAANLRGATYLHAAALFRLSSLSGIEGNYEEAEKLARRALEVGKNHDSLTAFGFVDLGNVFVYAEKYDRATQYFEQALRLARAASARRAEARAHLALASLQMSQGRVEPATAHAANALEYYKQAGFRGLQNVALTLIAQGQARLGNLAAAQKTYEDLVALAQERQVPRQMAEQHNQLANLLLLREHYVTALEHCDVSLDLYRRMKAPYDLAHGTLLRLDILGRLGRFAEAERELGSLFTPESGTGKATGELRRLRLLRQTTLALFNDDLTRVKQLAREGLRSSGGAVSPEVDIEFRLLLALGLIRSGQSHLARTHLDEAAKLASGLGDSVLQSRLSLARAEWLVATGSHADAAALAESLGQRFEKEGRFESAWLSYSVASQAAALAGSPELARLHTEGAARASRALAGTLPPDAQRTFRLRKDLDRIGLR